MYVNLTFTITYIETVRALDGFCARQEIGDAYRLNLFTIMTKLYEKNKENNVLRNGFLSYAFFPLCSTL